MKRSIVAIATGLGLFCYASMTGALTISNSKHDLSVNAPGPIKSAPVTSGGTGEICVFCHTPHSATTDAPLWNRSLPVGSYQTYTSDVMAGLGYTLEDPLSTGAAGKKAHMKTKLCMSCHDGTIAMGTLVNYPNDITPPITILGTSGNKMPSTAAGYMGTDIRDDHPVAVQQLPGSAAGQDPELKVLGSSSLLRLYRADTGAARKNDGVNYGDYVECTSCHDAHDNKYGKFLIDDNVGSKLCRSCHEKEGDDSTNAKESMHSNTLYSTAYSPTTGGTPATLGTTVQDVKCMDCHYPHKAGLATYVGGAPNAGAGKYLLTYQEEKSCFNNLNRWGQSVSNCHGTGAGATKNIESQVVKLSAHKVGNYSFSNQPHNATEGSGGANWASSSWHVECADCHNAHTAGGQLHSTGTNTITTTQPLYGAGGVDPTWSASNWTGPTWGASAYLEPTGVLRSTVASVKTTKEFQVCLRCHSSFAPNPSSMTDQGLEFNTGNTSYHPVVQPKSSSGTLVSPWTTGKTMYCSDCHGSNGAGDPGGPHGSTASPGYILIKNYQDSYVTRNFSVPLNDLCFACHSESVYQSGSMSSTGTGFMTSPTGSNLHTVHKVKSNGSPTATTAGYSCVNCHVKIPHGYRNKALIITGADIGVNFSKYAAGGAPKISSWTNPGSQSYAVSSCATAVGCH